MVERPRLGEQITRLIRSLTAVKGWNMTTTLAYVAEQTHYSPDMIHRWRQGNNRPIPETIEILAKIGKKEANLDRAWGESFLYAASYHDSVALLNALWGPKEIRSIPCNLPAPEHVTLFGRDKEIVELLELLSSQYAAHLISVDGIGGVGKTALVLNVAYRCLRASTGEVLDSQVPIFDAIIFVSAKQQYLTAGGLLSTSEAQHTLCDLFREVAQTLNRFEITQTMPENQASKVRDALSRQRTLLIVDNLETMEGRQEIIAFLFKLPPQVKVVFTTREKAMFSPIRLEQLGEEEALNLIEKEAKEKGVALSTEQTLTLYRRIGGIPAAMVYSIGQVAKGYSVKTVLDRVFKARGDVARFCFEGSVSPLRGQGTHQLLIAIALFPKHPVRDAIAHTVGLSADSIVVEEGLMQLQQLSLINFHEGRYHMLPLTREYAIAEIADYQEFEREARKRWVEWYMNFIDEYGGDDWLEWHIKYDQVEEEWENLLAVLDWCASHEQYNIIKRFWSANGLLSFSHIYGYWDERLTWLNWLIQAAERRSDWSNMLEAVQNAGYTLTLMGQLEEANRYFRRAWNLREHIESSKKINLATDIALLYINCEEFARAQCYLSHAKALLDETHLDEPEYSRRWINIQYNHGRICYEQRNYSQAELYFKEVVDRAYKINWQRASVDAQNWLANTAIEQDRFEEAESLLQTGLIVSERNKDKRRTALYRSTFAYLNKKRGELKEARYWAQAAIDDFERLGMQKEIEKMNNLLD